MPYYEPAQITEETQMVITPDGATKTEKDNWFLESTQLIKHILINFFMLQWQGVNIILIYWSYESWFSMLET